MIIGLFVILFGLLIVVAESFVVFRMFQASVDVANGSDISTLGKVNFGIKGENSNIFALLIFWLLGLLSLFMAYMIVERFYEHILTVLSTN